MSPVAEHARVSVKSFQSKDDFRLLCWFDTRRPLFRQERVGRNQKPFVLVKFRTMRPDTTSVASHLADSSAITPLGRFLRRTKMNELPQLWNVLRGQMSLVGSVLDVKKNEYVCLFSVYYFYYDRERGW